MAWRLAKSLEVLRGEIRAKHPGTTVWTIGDQEHASGWSDHNPTASGVVCAIDVLGDKGLDLQAFADHLVRDPHQALKYVIFNRRIWSKARASEGWRPYSGSNPHTTHAHVSVGIGPDGRSTGPYDDTTPWGIASTEPSMEDDMQLTDKIKLVTGQAVPYSDTEWTVGWTLASTHYYVLQARNQLAAELAAGKKRDEAILAKLAGADTKTILDAINKRAAEDAARDAALLAELQNMASGGATAQEILDQLAARLAGAGE